ncbi:MAG: DUF1801 domain-containing protein [archaeon]|nr:DUF1801 domain-containing protein [archaeon]
MVSSDASDPAAYLADLEEGRRAPMTHLFEAICEAMPDWVPSMHYGMLSWCLPDPSGGEEPLVPVSLACQKRHMSLYLMPVYMSPALSEAVVEGYAAIGIKPNMGKSCLRFTKVERIPLDVILGLLRGMTREAYLNLRAEALARGTCD